MNIIQLGDMHLQDRKPIGRKDNYQLAQQEKLNEVVMLSNKYDCPIVSVGDLLNNHFISDKLKTAFGEIISQLVHPLYFVWGNHDTEYHSSDLWENTSLGAITANNPKVRHISNFKKDYGISWDWIDWNCPLVDNGSDLLLTHKAVYNSKMSGGKNSWIEKDKAFGIPITSDVLKRYKMILCGHWHKQYVFQYGATKVLNAGALLRKTVDIDYDPIVYLIDLKTYKHVKIYIESAKPYSEVMSKNHIKKKYDIDSIDSEQLTDILSGSKKSKSNFIEKLNKVLESDKLDPNVKKILNQTVAELITKGDIQRCV